MRAFIFDLDGTMVDNMMVHHHAWQKKLKSLGLDLSIEETRQKVHGINEEILERLFGDRFSPEERRQLSFEKEFEYREMFKNDLKLIVGLEDLLNQLKQDNKLLAIGSAAPPENVDFVLDGTNIRHYFDVVLHAKDVRRGKPDPEIYLKIADKLGVFPENCVVFEDSPTGAEAAHRAQMKTVIITTTHLESEFERFPNVLKFITNYSTGSRDLLKDLGLSSVSPEF